MRKGARKKLLEEALHAWKGAGMIRAFIRHSILNDDLLDLN